MTVADSGPVPDRLMTKERFARSAGTQIASPGPLMVAATSKRRVWDIEKISKTTFKVSYNRIGVLIERKIAQRQNGWSVI